MCDLGFAHLFSPAQTFPTPRLLAWYTDGGFVDEYGVFHASGHYYNITMWECLNEMEHGLSPEEYTLQYDRMVLGMRQHAPKGSQNLKFMALALEDRNPAYFSYIFNKSNHLPGVPLPDAASFHFYAGCSVRHLLPTLLIFF